MKKIFFPAFVFLLQAPINLNPADSKELFSELEKWKIVTTDLVNHSQKIAVSEVVCAETLDHHRQVGCSLYDNLHDVDLTKTNKFAVSVFEILSKHLAAECDDDDGDTCTITVDKILCDHVENNYSCSLE